jgi:GTP-binding protein HflX
MKKECVFDPLAPTCSVLLLGVHAPYNRTPNIEGYFQEFVNLAKSNGLPTDITMFMRIRDIDSAYFITKGKLEEVKKMCDEHNIDHVVISEPLSVQQERNLSDYLHCKVFDRTQLILEIFEKAADSAEGKTQVQIAMLQHKKSRVAGHGVHMSQQAGILGLRSGAGETAKERELRHLENLILKLRKQLVQIEKVRQTQRKRRLESNLPLMCLIGYTNAGKSSILNALTKSDVLAEDKLFATLDTTTRELYINNAKVGLISDTVGFIQNLPHNLINAFKSTLAELQYANLLIEVVDASDPNWESHIEIVRNILNDLDLQHKEILYVFNKIDKVESTQQLLDAFDKYKPYILTSALNKEGISPLKEYIESWVQNRNQSSLT